VVHSPAVTDVARTRSIAAGVRQAWPTHRTAVRIGLLGSLTLGLAPFYPHAHVWKQLVALARGTLTEPIDMLDLALHGAPWIVLVVALARLGRDALGRKRAAS
jgi:hypothetical protein